MFNVLIDTREQCPWDFSSASIKDTKSKKLDTGDYTIEGFETILCIERKKSVSEVASNVLEDRFERELVRMTKYKYAFIILEFSVDDLFIYPQNSDVPKRLWRKLRIKGDFIMKRLSEIQIKHGIHIIFAGNADYAARIATSLMKRVYEQHPN